jgi:threonine dehydrogenase-like Zn-dependent dehydrogenase
VTVRAAVLEAGRSVRLAELPLPEPGPGEVRVRLEGCGVCGSDTPVWEGRPWFDYPREPGSPGHEGWGRVESVGQGVDTLEIGARVAGLTYHAYADRELAPAEMLVPLPDRLDGRPFPGEALGCAVNVFRRSGIRAGQTIAVVGVGFLGAVVTQLAAREGATVLGVSRREAARQTALRMGAAQVFGLDGPPDPEWCVVVVEAGGRQATLDAATPLARVRGRLVIAGFHQDGPRQVDLQSWNWRGIDVINAHERDPDRYLDGIRVAARWVAEGRLDPDPLYTHRFPLSAIGEALEIASRRPEGFMKALVVA